MKTFIAIFLITLLSINNVIAKNVNLSWDASASPPANVLGYKIHYGNASGNYPNIVDAGNVLTYTIPNLIDTIDYYFVATAYGLDNNGAPIVSSFSNEVSLFAAPPPTPQTTFNIGETTIFENTDSGNGGLLLAQKATLTQEGAIITISFYVVNAAGKLRLGVYDALGVGGLPKNKKAETLQITPVTGWNTVPVITKLKLLPGDYWLAYQPSSSLLSFPFKTSTGDFVYMQNSNSLPTTFSINPTVGTTNWSFYATLETKLSINPPLNFRLEQ